MTSQTLRGIVLLLAVLSVTLATAVAQQSIQPVGDDLTLDIATWNVEWFGSSSNGPSNDPVQFDRVRRVIEESEIDLWSLQEISDEADFNRLLDDLGPTYTGYLATESGTQRVAFVYRNEVLRANGFGAVKHVLTNENFQFAGRPPLRFDARHLESGQEITFIAIHLKAGSDTDDHERRRLSSGTLKDYMDRSLPDDNVVLIGDFNDELSDSITATKTSPFLNLKQDATAYRFLTSQLDLNDVGTYCRNAGCTGGATLDHILVSNELAAYYVAESCNTYSELTDIFISYDQSVSDHLPVFASLSFTSATSDEPAIRDTPSRLDLIRTGVSTYRAESGAQGVLEIVDLLGRVVSKQEIGAGVKVNLDVATWSPGLYLVRALQDDGQVSTAKLTVTGS